MRSASVRRPAVAGTWYPGTAQELASTIDGHLAVVDDDVKGDLVALIAPHAGLMYSGPVAAHAYRLLRERAFDTAVLVGPSHFVAFDGVAIVPSGGFETPFGVAWIDADCASALMAASSAIHDSPSAHAREHSLEMQLPFLQRLAPGTGIVPLLMGHQTPRRRVFSAMRWPPRFAGVGPCSSPAPICRTITTPQLPPRSTASSSTACRISMPTGCSVPSRLVPSTPAAVVRRWR